MVAARQLIDQGAQAVLVKGGHLRTTRLTDTLIDAIGVRWQRCTPRLISRNLHGTDGEPDRICLSYTHDPDYGAPCCSCSRRRYVRRHRRYVTGRTEEKARFE